VLAFFRAEADDGTMSAISRSPCRPRSRVAFRRGRGGHSGGVRGGD
jgi:hypothetical protein